jgi:hypothetical protein
LPRRKTSSGRSNKALREFVSEAEEILESMRNDVADLSDATQAGATVIAELP